MLLFFETKVHSVIPVMMYMLLKALEAILGIRTFWYSSKNSAPDKRL